MSRLQSRFTGHGRCARFLILGTDLRSADVLTSALGDAHTNTGLPHAVGAGLDCTQTMVEFTFGTRWPAPPSLAMTKH